MVARFTDLGKYVTVTSGTRRPRLRGTTLTTRYPLDQLSSIPASVAARLCVTEDFQNSNIWLDAAEEHVDLDHVRGFVTGNDLIDRTYLRFKI